MPEKEDKIEENRDLVTEFNNLISGFKEKYRLNDYELIDLILEKKVDGKDSVPIDIFVSKLGCLEAAVKYLRENKGLEFKEIAGLVGRSSGVVINSYRKAVKKFSEKFAPKSEILVPVKVFTNKKFSILENLVVYLKDELGFRFRKIGKMIQRNEKTVWTVYKRAEIKR